MFVNERFYLAEKYEDIVRSMIPNFGYNGFGEFIFYRTYSRTTEDGRQESWADVVIRVTNGIMSIRKDWYAKNHIFWDASFWQDLAFRMAVSMFKMEWLPPGRGLWAMGTDFIYERGAMALSNCGATEINTETFGADISWLMDALMCGVGAGFEAIRDDKMKIYKPVGTYDFIIPDTREGWALSEKLLIDSYMKPNQQKPRMIYDKVRGPGMPIRGFGGISSGPQPLKDLHRQTEEQFELFGSRVEYDSVYLKTNIANLTGCAVVAGNVRRSAELGKGSIQDPVFVNLKNYEMFPERESYGWMSNNSVALDTDEDFECLGEIAKLIIKNGEPGFMNMKNLPYGRIGKHRDNVPLDYASLFNPCAEIPLENKELCNIAETFPTICNDPDKWLQACRYATIYCSTVSLLPTHSHETNRVIARNRRIGVGLVDYTGWIHTEGVHKVTKWLRKGYDTVREVNDWTNDEAGVPKAIRVTTIKPGGTTPKLPGKTSGAGYPTFDYTLRRVRVAKNSPVHPLLCQANVPYEEDYFDRYTDVFEWPIIQGPAPAADQITIWQQAMNIVVLQREWSDNAVSNTLYFRPMWALIEAIDSDFRDRLEFYFGVTMASRLLTDKVEEYIWPETYKAKFKYYDSKLKEIKIYEYDPKNEEKDVAPVLAAIAPVTKSVSVLPHSPKGAYRQMPEEGISKAEYDRRLAEMSTIDWSQLNGSDGMDERYCSGPICELPVK